MIWLVLLALWFALWALSLWVDRAITAVRVRAIRGHLAALQRIWQDVDRGER